MNVCTIILIALRQPILSLSVFVMYLYRYSIHFLHSDSTKENVN